MRLLKKLLPLGMASVLVAILATPVLAQIRVFPQPLENSVGEGIVFENLLTYSPMQHDIISHVLTLGYAAQAAGLVYFLATLSNIAPAIDCRLYCLR